MIIKFGQNGETEEKPVNAENNQESAADSESGGEEKPYLTEDEMFAETPDFWKERSDVDADPEETQSKEKEPEGETDFRTTNLNEDSDSAAEQPGAEQDTDRPGREAADEIGEVRADTEDPEETAASEESSSSEKEKAEDPEKVPADFSNPETGKNKNGSELNIQWEAFTGADRKPKDTGAELPKKVPRHRKKKNASEKTHDRKKEAITRSLQEYKKKLMNYRTKKWIRYGAIVLAVVIAALIVTNVIRNWQYTSYSVILTDTREDVVSYDYCSLNGNILKYGAGGATLVDRNNQTIWSVSYSMQSPAVAICGSTVAIYDRSGTGICICDESGQIGAVSTSAPIVKVDVAAQGVVAAILEDNENTWIQYYDQSGESISMTRTTMDSPGYPMDLGLSGDGTLMAVSYLCFVDGQPETRLYFYNFGSVGQNMMDNQVGSFEYGDTLIPQLEYLEGSTCVAFRENGFTVYGGAQIPEERAEVTVSQEIISTFYNSSYIGLVLQNDDSENEFRVVVYDTAGREVLQQDTNFSYRSIEIADGQVVMSNQSQLCVYSLEGVEKFNGSLEQAAQQLFSIGQNRYVMITEEGLNIIRLG